RGGVVGVERPYLTLLRAERAGLAAEGMQPDERRPQPLELEVGLDPLQPVDFALGHPVVEIPPEVEDFVHLVEPQRVVQNDLARGVLREDGAPEAYLRLDRRGAGKPFAVFRARRAQRNRRYQ